MVDKYQSRKIYVETDYDNIVLIDPNKIVLANADKDGNNIQERLVAHEELVFYAKLEANVIPRTKLVLGSTLDDSVINTTIATLNGDGSTQINFLSPQGKKFLDTSWSDQQTGLGSLEGKGANQTEEYVVGTYPNQKVVRKSLNREDTQGLGITKITIKNNPSYIPQVTIEMVDVQGRTLFEQGDQSPYSAFFQLPYPMFKLTVKGYYGKAVQYELMLKSFNARFDPADGNYKITTEYIGRTAAILRDLDIQHLFTVSRMYPRITTVETRETAQNGQQQVAQSQNVNESTKVQTSQNTKGNQILSSVYDSYISKGLLPEGFEKMSVGTFLNRIELLETYINEQFGPQELQVLDDIKSYRKDLTEFRKEIFSSTKGSFFNDFVGGDFPIKENPSKGYGYVYYPLKKQLRTSTQSKLQAQDRLDKTIQKYKEKLTNNKTFGAGGSFKIRNPETGRDETINSQIDFKISEKTILRQVDTNAIDYEKTFTLRKNRIPTQSELEQFTQELKTEINTKLNNQVLQNTQIKEEIQPYYVFGDSTDDGSFVKNSFLGLLDEMERQFLKSEQDIETRLSKALAEKIRRPVEEGGLGFNPTIRNVMGILCANADAFLRLMDDVHTNAYSVRTDPVRLTSIIDPEKNFGTDTKDAVQSVTIDGKLSEDNIVYPWPQYFELERDQKGNEQYVIKYPGSPKSIARTKGYLYDKWPEIHFVEEYLKGTVRKDIQTNPISLGNPNEETEYIGITALEFPNTIQPYQDTTVIPFLYEIYERAILSSYYNKLFRPGNNNVDIPELISDYEFNNIRNAISSSPDLIAILRDNVFTEPGFRNALASVSNNSEGQSWTDFRQEIFTKTYIQNYVNNPTQIYDITVLENTPVVTNGASSTESIVNYLNSTNTNVLTTYDTLPTTNFTWIQNNFANGASINSIENSNNTNKIIRYNSEKKAISNYLDSDGVYQNTVFTSLEWQGNTGKGTSQDILNFDNFVSFAAGQGIKNISRQGAKDFYSNKTYENLFITESFINYGNEYGPSQLANAQTGITQIQTTSLLNTPYFTNAISVGVDNKKSGDENPYVGLGYLLINSLPIATLREKYKSFDENYVATDSDYLSSTLTKFSAIHKLPYAWILKYGSIWHRYKTFIENSSDILDGIWENYDYSNKYAPINGLITTTYSIKNYTGGTQPYNLYTSRQFVDGNGTLVREDSLNTGLYPKTISDTYYFFTGKDLLTNYSEDDWSNAYNKGLRIGKLSDIHLDLDDVNGSGVNMDSYFSYLNVKDNADFIKTVGEGKSYLLMPSAGYLPFNQTKYEITNLQNQIVKPYVDNKSIYNGSVRTLWKATNYGYYNNDLVRRPTPTEYIKQIFSGQSQQDAFRIESDNPYSNIEEIFSVFDRETLDILENEFLKFCKPSGGGIPDLDGELTQNTYFEINNAANKRFRNIEYVLSDIMFTENQFNPSQSPYFDSNRLADEQMNSTVSSLKRFLDYEVILKIGNAGKYDRRVFKSFSDSNTMLNPLIPEPYITGTLPGDIANTTLATSQLSFPDEWAALQTYVGFSTISGLTYSDQGSYITDFFIDTNTQFNVENIQTYSSLIKIYATQKLNNPQLNNQSFIALLNDLDTQQFNFLTSQLNDTFRKCRTLPKVTVENQTGGVSAVDGDVSKLELYTTFKSINDKWIAGGNFQTRTLFEDFLFLDRANRDIGDVFVLDTTIIKEYLKGRTASFSFLQLIGEILAKNNFIFMALPSYINFYGVQEVSRNSTPLINYDVADSAFGTHLNVDYQNSRPKFLCLYVGKPSEHLDMRENKISRFRSDTFDLRRSTNNPLIENQQNKTNWDKSNRVVGFNIDFGTRNQNMFKSISLDQNQFKSTSETFQVLSDMANLASGDKVAQQTASLYNVYRTRSYTCAVTSMGNAMIQPTMYFNLRHVPMFYGPYFITNVSHDITVNGFETSFEGIRQPIFSFPSIDKLVMSINKNLLKRASEIYRKKKKQSGGTTTQTESDISQNKKEVNDLCNNITIFPDVDFVEMSDVSISVDDVINYIKSLPQSNDIKSFVYGILLIQSQNSNISSFKCSNNNLYNINTKDSAYQPYKAKLSGQVCISNNGVTSPIAAFDDFRKSIDIVVERFKAFESLVIPKLKELNSTFVSNDSITAEALTRVYYTTWADSTGFGFNNKGIDINNKVNESITEGIILRDDFNKNKNYFLSAVGKFN